MSIQPHQWIHYVVYPPLPILLDLLHRCPRRFWPPGISEGQLRHINILAANAFANQPIREGTTRQAVNAVLTRVWHLLELPNQQMELIHEYLCFSLPNLEQQPEVENMEVETEEEFDSNGSENAENEGSLSGMSIDEPQQDDESSNDSAPPPP